MHDRELDIWRAQLWEEHLKRKKAAALRWAIFAAVWIAAGVLWMLWR